MKGISTLRLMGRAFLLSLAVWAVSGCSLYKIRDLDLSSVGVKYVVPTSTRSVDAVLLLELDNPSVSFTISDVEGTIHYYGQELGYVTAGELPVQARSVQVYELPCSATLADRVSLLDVLALAAKKDLTGLTADIKLHAQLGHGRGTTFTFNHIDISSLVQ